MNSGIIHYLESRRAQVQKTGHNENYAQVYSRAIRSIKQCTVPITTKSIAVSLKYIGEKLGTEIENWLRNNNLLNTDVNIVSEQVKKKPKKKRKPRKKKEYCPKVGSGPYAILLVLYKESFLKEDRLLTKTDICEMASEHTDTEMISQNASVHYDGWSCMNKTLIKKKLVQREHIRTKNRDGFSLTRKGVGVAKRLYETENMISNSEDEYDEYDERAVIVNEVKTKKKKRKRKKKKKKNEDKMDTDDDTDDVIQRVKKKPKKKKKKKKKPIKKVPQPSTSNVPPQQIFNNALPQNPLINSHHPQYYGNFSQIRNTQQTFVNSSGVITPLVPQNVNTFPNGNHYVQPTFQDNFTNILRVIDDTDQDDTDHDDTDPDDDDKNSNDHINVIDISYSDEEEKDKRKAKKRKRTTSKSSVEEPLQKRKKMEIEVSYLNSENSVVRNKDEAGVDICARGCKYKIQVTHSTIGGGESLNFNDPIQFQMVKNEHTNSKYICWFLDERNVIPHLSNDLIKYAQPYISITNSQRIVSQSSIHPNVSNVNANSNINELERIRDINNQVDINDYLKFPKPISTNRNVNNSINNIYQTVLFVDNRERTRTNNNDKVIKKIKDISNIETKSCQLGLGDMVWGIRNRSTNEELILKNTICERKTINDLCHSIVDGRLEEQFYRLEKSGIDKIIYIIEGDIEKEHNKTYGITPISLKKSLMNMLVNNSKVRIKRTGSINETQKYLAELSVHINSIFFMNIDKYQDFLVPLEEFNRDNFKNRNLTTGDIFGRQLMNLSRCTKEISSLLVDKFPNPIALMEEIEKSRNKKFLEDLQVVSTNEVDLKRVGPKLSSFIYDSFTK